MTKTTCPYKFNESVDCCGYSARGTVICNVAADDNFRAKHCQRFYRIVELNSLKPSCCEDLRFLFNRCAEDGGSLVGSFDIRKYPNDGKEVWRNYERIKFEFCPFCGNQFSSQDRNQQ